MKQGIISRNNGLSVKQILHGMGSLWNGRFTRLVCLVAMAAAFTANYSPVATNGEKTLRVGVYENAPKIFMSDDGKPSGIFIDIIESVAKKEGWHLKYVSGSWGEGLDRVKNGEIDLMPDVAYSPDREKIYTFHKVPVLSSWYQVYAPKGSNIRSILDLKEKRILVLERSVQEAAFNRLSRGFGLNSTIISVPDYKTMFESVARGDAEAAITNRFYGMMHAKKFGIEDTTLIFEPSDLFFAATRGDPKSLLSAIDRRLADLKKDSQSVYYESLKRWTEERIEFRFPAWLRVFGLVMGIVLAMSLAGSVILKHQVNARTMDLKKINQEMEQRILDRTAELAVAKERAEAADRIKSSFLATMSHELRTPLNSIIGFTGAILQELAGPLNNEQNKQMGMVKNSAQHLLSLINDVLDISKIEAGQLEVHPERFNLREVIEKVIMSIKPSSDKKGIALNMDIGDEISDIESDRRRVEQVLLNLLSNAVKFTDEGSVTLSVELIPRYEFPHGPCLTPAMRFRVIDTGMGIAPDDLKKLFQAFHQVDTGLARKKEGTGLGLAISRHLAELMGGGVTVESEYGKGSVFTFIIPTEARKADENDHITNRGQ
jgi:signal transduction histidine kinase